MKKFKWIIWGLVIILAGVAVWYWKFRTPKTEIVIETVKPFYGTISNSVTATGTVQPVDTVAVGTQVSGTIQKVYVDFNSPVKKGQLLAQIDKTVLEATVQQINANLQSARANVTYQKSNYDRQNQLYTAGAISKSELETALYQYKVSLQSVNSISAQLSSANRNLSYADIYSPIDGTVLSRSVSEGQTVAASLSTPTLFSIAKDLSRMQVQASIDEADIGNVIKGQRVIFTVDAFPEDTFAGIVKEIRLRPAVSANVVTYTTIIDAPNMELKLKPGMTASITVYTKEVDNTLLLPAKAITFKPDSILSKKYNVQQKENDNRPKMTRDSMQEETGTKAFVWIIRGKDLTRRRIYTGLDDETQIQVLSGLTLNDEIVTGYQQQEVSKKPTAKSPFMPARNVRRPNTGGGSTRPAR
jgi:HlyD family secretion protein